MRVGERRYRLAGVAAVVLCAVVAYTGTTTGPGEGERTSWRILFVRQRVITQDPLELAYDTWVASGDGSRARRLIENGERPTWSPDHRRIAFFRDANLWLANADGSGQEQVTARWTPDEAEYTHAETPGIAWGPLPGRIAFSRPEQYEVRSVHVEEPDQRYGSGVFEVLLESATPRLRALFGGNGGCMDTCPAWSPSGEHLVWARDGDIWVARRDMHPDPPERAKRTPYPWSYTRLAAVAHYDGATDHASRWGYGATHLAWSPDGRLLAYGMNRYGGSGIDTIRIMRLKRTEEEFSFVNLSVIEDWLVTEQGHDPCFSPDGRRLLYAGRDPSCRLDHGGSLCAYEAIWLSTLDGKSRHKLIDDGEQPCV